MADASFDPYHRWLGIRCDDPPPDHFRLLGIERGETDPAVIDEAADRQMAHVRTHQRGRHAEAAARLLSEIAIARNCLLDPESRADYLTQSPDPKLLVATPLAVKTPPVARPSEKPERRSSMTWWLPVAVVCAGLMLLAVGAAVAFSLLSPPRETIAAGGEEDQGEQSAPMSRVVDMQDDIAQQSGAIGDGGPADPFELPLPRLERDVDDDESQPPETSHGRDVETELAFAPPALAAARNAQGGEGGQVAKFTDHRAEVRSVAISHDGKHLATAGADKLCFLLELPSLKVAQRIEHSMPLNDVAFRPTAAGPQLVLASDRDADERSGVFYWGLREGRFLGKLYDSDFTAPDVAVSQDGSRLAVTMGGSAARIYFLPTRGRTGLTSPREDYPCRDVAFIPDGTHLLQASGPQVAKWIFTQQRSGPAGLIAERSPSFINCLVATPDGKHVLTGHDDGLLRISSLESGAIVSELRGHRGAVTSIAIATEKALACTAGADGKVIVWDLTKQKAAVEWTGHNGAVHAVAMLASGRYIASAGADKTVRLWDLEGKPSKPSTPIPPEDPLPPPAPLARGDLPVPDADELTKARSLIRDVFKDELARADSSEEKTQLSTNLLNHAAETKNSVERYALIAEAGRLGLDAGDPKTALDAVQQIVLLYDVDGTQLKAKTLQGLLATVSTTGQRADLANAALALTHESAAADRHDIAVGAASLAQKAASGARDGRLLRKARGRYQRAVADRDAFEAYQTAASALKEDNTNAAANLIAGRYLCFVRGDWGSGLPLLAAGSDAALAALAEEDLASPSKGEQRLALADGWQAAASKIEVAQRDPYLTRALHWYKLALPGLTTLGKLKAQKAIDGIEAQR